MTDVDRYFAADGPLAAAIGGFRPRSQQLEMAERIAAVIRDNGVLVAEAGTGTGKTFAYLVPALLAGGKVIISTGTKTLQDQLFKRDLPTVRDALGVGASIALLKGRANYVCPYHLQRGLDTARFASREEAGHLRRIARFAERTRSGDKAECVDVPEESAAWAVATSTRENCLSQECPHYKQCFVLAARQEALVADIVVVNHHLFFADVMLKDDGMGELLPSCNTVIFDEAHQLPETATLFFGESISTSQILELCRDSLAEGLSHARDGAEWAKIVSPLERAARDLRLAFPQDSVRFSVQQIAPSSSFFDCLDTLRDTLLALIQVLEEQAERAETIEQCRVRSLDLQTKLDTWCDEAAQNSSPDGKLKSVNSAKNQGPECVLWVEAYQTSLQLHRTPLSIAPIFNKQREGSPRTWIFASATMAVKNDFSHYVSQMGLWDEPARTWPSPFNYQEQGILYVPEQMPQPNSREYTDAVVDAALPLIIAAGGRTFLLCTTNKAVKHRAERLKAEFEQRGLTFPLFVQGDAGRTELLDRFRASGQAVLIGSQSFWEGVDVRGEALSLVIIDKLPFAPPDDPVLAARIEAMEKKGLNGFVHHQLPEAIINLKQGAGRLIRDETDRGVLMICDPRLISKPYGRRIWQSLPAFSRTREAAVVVQFFTDLEAQRQLKQQSS